MIFLKKYYKIFIILSAITICLIIAFILTKNAIARYTHNSMIQNDTSKINVSYKNLAFAHADFEKNKALYVGFNKSSWEIGYQDCEYERSKIISPLTTISLMNIYESKFLNFSMLEYYDEVISTMQYSARKSIKVNEYEGYIINNSDRYIVVLLIDADDDTGLAITFAGFENIDFSLFETEDIKTILKSIYYKNNKNIVTRKKADISYGKVEISPNVSDPTKFCGETKGVYFAQDDSAKRVYLYKDNIYKISLSYNGFSKADKSYIENEIFNIQFNYTDSKYYENTEKFYKDCLKWISDYATLKSISYGKYSGFLFLDKRNKKFELCLCIDKAENIYLDFYCHPLEEGVSIATFENLFDLNIVKSIVESLEYKKSASFENEISKFN